MNEFDQLLEEFSKPGYSMYSTVVPESQWGDRSAGERYLEQFWMSQMEYERRWRSVQDRIFVHQERGLPDMLFRSEFEIAVSLGGCLFTEADFSLLRQSVLAVGDKTIAVVENTFGGRLQEPAFRLRFSSNIEWKELTSGSFVSAILLEMPHKEYFVFGESGLWGRYSASDYKLPLDILGYAKTVRDDFARRSSILNDNPELIGDVPAVYRRAMESHRS